ncbi:MAG: PqqD family protein [Cytophagales bacterium]|nr:PqqD family protein [Cytophagales bacterium]
MLETNKVVRNEQIIFSSIAEEVIIMDTETNYYISLDEIASVIWESISKPIAVQELCQSLCSQYDVDYDVCLKDVTKFLSESTEKGWVIVS